jgi:6-phosphogluconolactonase (cycloisomerase 2 family)
MPLSGDIAMPLTGFKAADIKITAEGKYLFATERTFKICNLK